MVVGIAVAMFIALFGWGATYFGWSDPDGKVQLALATSFILGMTDEHLDSLADSKRGDVGSFRFRNRRGELGSLVAGIEQCRGLEAGGAGDLDFRM